MMTKRGSCATVAAVIAPASGVFPASPPEVNVNGSSPAGAVRNLISFVSSVCKLGDAEDEEDGDEGDDEEGEETEEAEEEAEAEAEEDAEEEEDGDAPY